MNVMMKDQRTKLILLLFQPATVTKMALPLWNVIVSLEIARAIRDSQEANVMNANQISLGTSVTHVMKPSLIIHLAKVGLKDLFFDF